MKNIISLFFMFFSFSLFSQNTTHKKYYSENKKHKFYLYWGYNRCAFLKSDIHFKGNDFDFTLFDVVAKERPTPFSFKNYFKLQNITIPQYDYRLGFFLNQKWAISIGLDHKKYVVAQNQTVKISGEIKPSISTKYAGIYDKKDILITPDFLDFEHTDGLNLLSFDVEKLSFLKSFYKNKMRLNYQFGAGAGLVIPRTDVKVLGYGIDNPFHQAGYGISAKAGLKLDILRHFFLQTEIRSGFLHLNDILINNTNNTDRARQNIVFGEWYLVGGWYF